MDKLKFTTELKKINLSKKEFAQMANISYNTVNNWNDENRPVPPWVKSWLENYIKSKSYEDIKQKVFEIEGVE